MKAIIAKKQTNIYRKPGLVWLKSRFFFLGPYACNKLIKILLTYNQERILNVTHKILM